MADRGASQGSGGGGDQPLESPGIFPVRGYVIMNLLFWAFCAVEVVIIRLWLKDIQGVIFFFVLLAIGFTLVSIYDGLCDRFAARAKRQEQAASASSESRAASS